MGVRRLFSLFVFGLALVGWYGANAQSLKDVSATRLEQRAPAKNYSFSSETPLKAWNRKYSQDDVSIVSYDSNDGSETLYGVLDRRDKRPKWLLQPHYESIRDFSANALAVKRVHDSEHPVCILNLNDGTCPITDFNWVTDLTYREYQALPAWVGANGLRVESSRQNTRDLQLFTTDDRPLTIVRGAMFGQISGRHVVKAYDLDGKMVVRTMSETGDIRDAVLSQEQDGTVSVAYSAPFAVVEMNDARYRSANGRVDLLAGPIETKDIVLMQTVDAALGLVWPRYQGEDGVRPMPEDLLGLLPLTFLYQDNRLASEHFGDNDAAIHYCCETPLAWVAIWSKGEDEHAYALMRQRTIPDYEKIVASRSAADYSEIQPLWSAGRTNQRDAAIDEGQLIGQYAFHRFDGQVQVFRGDHNEVMGAGPVVEETTVSAASFPAWLDQAIRTQAKRAAAADASYAALQEQKRAYKQAHEQALAEQRQRLARERKAAQDARQAELDAAAAARAAAAGPQQRMERVYGDWALSRVGYCSSNTWQTDLYAIANAKKVCRDRGGDPGPTWVSGNGFEPFELNTDQCYRAQAVTECYFN